MIVPRETLKAALNECEGYKAFSSVCQDRVQLLEGYKKDADAIIEDQEKRVLAHKDEVDALKRQRNVLTPIAAALAGIALGFFYAQQQD